MAFHRHADDAGRVHLDWLAYAGGHPSEVVNAFEHRDAQLAARDDQLDPIRGSHITGENHAGMKLIDGQIEGFSRCSVD
jgi:hypothetical protein